MSPSSASAQARFAASAAVVGRITVSALSSGIALLSLLSGCERDRTSSRPELQGASAPVASATPSPKIQFRDITEESGIRFRYANGEESGFRAVPEYVGGGLGILDLDLDGALDLCFAGGGIIGADQNISGVRARLFRQLHHTLYFTDVTEFCGLDSSALYSHGVAVCDFDNDGFSDVLLTGWQGMQVWQNQGDGSFVETTRSTGLDDSRWSTSTAWGDLNADGAPDLYVARYVNWSWVNHRTCAARDGSPDICNPRTFDPLPDSLYFSDQQGGFRDVTDAYGIRADGKGLGVLMADLDADHDVDIYVANDTTVNFLYENQGDGTLREVGMISGTAVDQMGTPDGSMGVDLGDYNGDGRPDLWVTNYEQQLFALYRNTGSLSFVHASEASGLAEAVGNRVGWGTTFQDLDLDGDLDLFSSVGHPHFDSRDDRKQLPLLLENLNSRVFRNVSAAVTEPYFQSSQNARGVAAADLDNDGKCELVVAHLKTDSVVLKNVSPDTPSWSGLRLVGRSANRDAIGAAVVYNTNTGRSITRFMIGGGSYLSTSDRRIVIAVGAGEAVERATVLWPDGTSQAIRFKPNEYLTVVQSPASEPN